MELWPILCLVRSVSHTPFVVGLYCGAKKPASLSDYLDDFVTELCTLLGDGVTCDSKHYVVDVGCFVCDAPARSFVKNVKSHTGYNGCDKCKQEGLYINKRMTFPEINAAVRTDVEFASMSDEAQLHSLLYQLVLSQLLYLTICTLCALVSFVGCWLCVQ